MDNPDQRLHHLELFAYTLAEDLRAEAGPAYSRVRLENIAQNLCSAAGGNLIPFCQKVGSHWQ